MMKLETKIVALVALALVLGVSSANAASRRPIADVSVGGAQAEWAPLRVDYDHLVLTVVGPDGYVNRQEFPAGAHPSFGLFDASGYALPDGLYKWELSLVPIVDAAMQEQMAEVRAAGGMVESVSPSRQSGAFSILEGALVSTEEVEVAAPGAPSSISVPGGPPQNVVVTNADGVIRNSLCVGFDCPNSPSFSDSTILLMENNTRIKFGDTSVGSFPTEDWEIEANSNLSGGQSYLGFNDCGSNSTQGGCATDLVFAVESGAPSSALYVENSGEVGLGTSNPVADLHIVEGDTPTLRLEQDGSSGFAPQTWDVAGNETSFFIRDATNGSTLPFRIRPGSDSNALVIGTDGDVGVGVLSPEAPLHVTGPNADEQLLLLEGGGTTTRFGVTNTISGNNWQVGTRQNGSFFVTLAGSGVDELQLDASGNLTVTGDCVETDGACADYVFEPDYELRPMEDLASFIAENKHLPNVPSTEQIRAEGVRLQHFQGRLLEKIEELTLYTLQQHELIGGLQARLEALESTAPAATDTRE